MLLDISGNLSFLNYLIASVYLEKHENNSVIISTYRQTVLEVATYFKLSSIFSADSAVDAFAIDDIQNKFRFTLVYSLQSSTNNISIQIITKVTDGSFICSLQSIFPAFNWAEREIWDLSGIFFLKHPDLRRILTDYGFNGHPLRKDFPVSGFREVYYSDISKQVLYDKIELTQNFRLFSITSNWAYAETI